MALKMISWRILSTPANKSTIQDVTVTIVSGVGLYDSESVDIEVVQP